MTENISAQNKELQSTHADTHEHWDMVLSPKTGLFDINLKEIWH